MSQYIPSPTKWVAEQVERYESSGGTEGLTLRDTGLPDERQRLWPIAVAAYPPYQAYQDRTERLIPIFVAEPTE